MDEYTKYIIQMHLYWIENGFTKEDIRKIRSLVAFEDPFQNVTFNKMQIEMRCQMEYKPTLMSSDFEKITFLYLNYSERVLDLSFLKYCVNLKEIVISNQKLKNLKVLENLENIRMIDASSNEIENIDVLYSFQNLEELNLEYNPTLSLKPIVHLNRLKHLKIDEINSEEGVFQILKNNKNCSVDYIIKGDTLDYEKFIFPKYHIILSKKDDSISILLTGMNDNNKFSFSVDFPIDFPKEMASQSNFKERYINKIKQETTEHFEKILEEKIQINGEKIFYDKGCYSFEYNHNIE